MKDVYTTDDLRNWPDETIRLGVIGDPVAHSLSPQMQNAALRACGIPLEYARFEIRPNELAEALELFAQREFIGLNVTVWSYLDQMNFGLIACKDAMPDLWDLADGLHDALEELQKAVSAA